MTRRPSWVPGAGGPGDFPLENLPYGVFDDGRGARCGVAIGDRILDIGAAGLDLDPELFAEPAWNRVMHAGPALWRALRETLTEALSEETYRGRLTPHLVPMAASRMLLPFRVSEFTDFYSSRHHAFNVGALLRGPENALGPNWLSMPIGYNGRASSVVVSGTPVRRPWGQVKAGSEPLPRFAPSARFDFELELGAVVGQPSEGMVSVPEAEAMIFGYVLLNDWSARDIQAWEYQPLGPFQSKAAATTISPWIVTAAALAPFRRPTPPRERALLPYLGEAGPGLFAIDLDVALTPQGGRRQVIARTSHAELYYSPAQQLAHHASSGCPMRVGDLLGSGTISGPGRDSCGSLIEITRGGADPLLLADGTARAFLEDGDCVVLTGSAQGDGYRIGFGECGGRVLPAVPLPRWAGG
jgi:fumarylacetoacetase